MAKAPSEVAERHETHAMPHRLSSPELVHSRESTVWPCGSIPESFESTATVKPTRSVISEQTHDSPDKRFLSRRAFVWGSMASVLAFGVPLPAEEKGTSTQPFGAQVKRLIDALAFLGEPFTAAECLALSNETMATILAILDRRCLFEVHVNPEARVSVSSGPARAQLVEKGWRCYLVKVTNQAKVTATLQAESPQARSVYDRAAEGTGPSRPPQTVSPSDVVDRWLELTMFNAAPMLPSLSSSPLEYQILELYARDRGKREAVVSFNIGAASKDLGFRDQIPMVFEIQPSSNVVIHMRDEVGQPTVGALCIRDQQGRIYPAKTKRLAPDFYFQPQIYRADGEFICLPNGTYNVEYSRGPEYLIKRSSLSVSDGVGAPQWSFQLERWINPADSGWYSGDHHIHASGCMHYQSPTEGVMPEEITRHIRGEALTVGEVLTWAPSYYYQKRFFEGKINTVSTRDTLVRYDLEVSGFPSSHSGHLVLIRLKDQDYPDTKEIEGWPSWALPIAKWAKAQGAVVGFAHTALGLDVKSTNLPNYEIPSFNSIGANEILVDVTHDAVDFLSLVDTPSTPELNLWYHMLNAGLRVRAGGETDFPCMSDERVGAGRSYVQLDQKPKGDSGYDAWVAGFRAGRSYASDGKSHLMDFRVNGQIVGIEGSEVHLPEVGTVSVTVRVAALLDETPNEAVRSKPLNEGPYWHIERSRIGNTRQVAVEVIVNGVPVATKPVKADGSIQAMSFEVSIDRPSWIALRILRSSHTNPVFVLVGGRPVRASRRSVQWCLDCVDQLWAVKAPLIRDREREDARAAYDHARHEYALRLAECEAD
jgi:hypothetical protein